MIELTIHKRTGLAGVVLPSLATRASFQRGRRSIATPEGVPTTTTPIRKHGPKNDMVAILVAYLRPCATTHSITHREDSRREIRTARQTVGFRFLLMLSPCPSGWKSELGESVDLIRYAARCGAARGMCDPTAAIDGLKRPYLHSEATDGRVLELREHHGPSVRRGE